MKSVVERLYIYIYIYIDFASKQTFCEFSLLFGFLIKWNLIC
jgi:hypothetical protein